MSGLEQIDVRDQQGQREAVLAVPLGFVRDVALEKTSIVETGELVFKDEARGVLAYIFFWKPMSSPYCIEKGISPLKNQPATHAWRDEKFSEF